MQYIPGAADAVFVSRICQSCCRQIRSGLKRLAIDQNSDSICSFTLKIGQRGIVVAYIIVASERVVYSKVH
jgi:hypothetical protein